MASESATKLEEYFQCWLCNKPAVRPKLLQCLHTFCTDCLKRECNESDVTCPSCDMVTKEDLSSLQDNILLSNLLSSVRKQQIIRENMDLFCSSCEEKTPAEFMCMECDVVLCNKCLHTHQMLMPNHKKHVETVGTLRKLNADEFLKMLRRSKDLQCSTHEDQQISLYCSTCSTWLCVLCAVLEHKDHSYTTVKKQIALQQSELRETLSVIQTNETKFVESKSQLEQLVDKVNRDKYKLEDQIKARVNGALQKVKEEERRLLDELQELHSSKTQKLQESLVSTENVLKRITVGRDVVSHLLRYATEQEILKLHKMIKSSLARLQQEKPMDVDVESTIIGFQECCVFPEKMLGSLIITKLKPKSTSDGNLQLPRCSSAAPCKKQEVGETSMGSINKRKWCTGVETQVSKKQCVKEEPNGSAEEVSIVSPDGHEQNPTSSIESVTSITEADKEELLLDTEGLAAGVSKTAESKMASPVATGDGAGEAVGREAGGKIPSDGQNGPPGSTEETLVFFDLETTGLENNCDIVQLSAVSGEKIFNKYILPSKPISEGASAVNGFQVIDGVLYLRGQPQSTSSLRDTMEAFLHFLQSLDAPLLIGHNIWRFDSPILFRVWEELSMKDQFASCITGFLDTFWLAKDIVPRSEVSSYRQTELVQVFLKKSYKAHNATEDAKSLQELYSVLKYTPEQKKSNQFSISQLESQVSLQPLLKEKILFSQLADKFAMQEVSLEKLQSAYQQGGESGLKKFLQSLGHFEPSYIRLSKFFSK